MFTNNIAVLLVMEKTGSYMMLTETTIFQMIVCLTPVIEELASYQTTKSSFTSPFGKRQHAKYGLATHDPSVYVLVRSKREEDFFHC